MSEHFKPFEHYGVTRTHEGTERAGWLVSLSRRAEVTQKAFMDKHHGGPDPALAAAQAYRDAWLEEHPPASSIALSQALQSHNTSGIPGVARYVDPRTGVARWEAFVSFENKKISRSFAVAKWGEDGAKQKAMAARQALLIQYQRDAVRLYSPAAKAQAMQQHPEAFGLPVQPTLRAIANAPGASPVSIWQQTVRADSKLTTCAD